MSNEADRTLHPHSQGAESAIREVNHGAGHKMVSSKCHKPFWDDCLEMEVHIRSHTALNAFDLHGEVPETVMTGETTDTSVFAEFGWHQWVMFLDTGVPFFFRTR